MNSLDLHFGQTVDGLFFIGSTGRSSSFANIGSSHFLQYQTGKATPKYLWLEISQSHCNPLTQLSYLCFMYSGYHFNSLPQSNIFSFKSRYFTNHFLLFMNSISV